jgi:hypothetical protein
MSPILFFPKLILNMSSAAGHEFHWSGNYPVIYKPTGAV